MTSTTKTATIELPERFMSKVVEVAGPLSTPCWHWTGRMDTNGKGRAFGRFWHEGRPVIAYRYALSVLLGVSYKDVPGVAAHQCDDSACCNPFHVEAKSQSENIKECYGRGRRDAKAESRARQIAARQRAKDEKELAYLDFRFAMAMADDRA